MSASFEKFNFQIRVKNLPRVTLQSSPRRKVIIVWRPRISRRRRRRENLFSRKWVRVPENFSTKYRNIRFGRIVSDSSKNRGKVQPATSSATFAAKVVSRKIKRKKVIGGDDDDDDDDDSSGISGVRSDGRVAPRGPCDASLAPCVTDIRLFDLIEEILDWVLRSKNSFLSCFFVERTITKKDIFGFAVNREDPCAQLRLDVWQVLWLMSWLWWL